MQYYLDDKEFGRVYINLRSGMKNIIFRCKEGEFHITMPREVVHGASDIRNAIDRNREQLRKIKKNQAATPPKVQFHAGMTIHCYGFDIVFEEQDRDPSRIFFNYDDPKALKFQVPQGMDYTSQSRKEWISKGLQQIIKGKAWDILPPLGEKVAQELNLTPRRFEIGRGTRKLGHCTPLKVISLSSNLLFLTEELIRYVICHELAHITHMNHSPEFHALVNQYTGGREAELEQKLRTFPWPILR